MSEDYPYGECPIEDHKKPVKLVCVNRKCDKPHLACTLCLANVHLGHNDDLILISQMLKKEELITAHKISRIRKKKIIKEKIKKKKEVLDQLEKEYLEILDQVDIGQVANIQGMTKQNFITLAKVTISKQNVMEHIDRKIREELSERKTGSYEFGNHKYIGQMMDGKKEGQGTIQWNNGDKYIGQWKDDLREGIGVYYQNDGGKYDGEYKKDLREGRGIQYWKNGDRYEGEWKDDRREGKGIYYYKNGTKYDGEWQNNMMEGTGIAYFQNGEYQMGNYKNGQRVGEHALFSCTNRFIKIFNFDLISRQETPKKSTDVYMKHK